MEKTEKKELIKISALTFVSPIFDLFSFSIIIYILEIVIDNNGADPGTILLSVGMGGVSLLKGLFEVYKCYVQNRFINFGAQKISMRVFELLEKEDLMEHNKMDPIQALTVVRDDTTYCMEMIICYITFWIQGVTLFIFFAALIWVSKLFGVFTILGLLAFMTILYLQSRLKVMNLGKKRRQYAIRSNAQITTAFGMFKETKIDRRAEILLDRYREASRQYARVQSRYIYNSKFISIMLQNSLMAVLFLALAVLLQTGIHIMSLLAPLVICMTFLLRMLPMAAEIVSQLVHIEFGRKSYEAVRDSQERYLAIKEQETADQGKRKKQLTFRQGLFIKDLTFGYLEKQKIFDHASIDIPAGKTIAIIGASGSGKTTFLDLVLGLLKPETGNIRYDDYDIVTGRDMEGECKANVGDIVSYIPQTVYLNGETIRNNVAFYEKENAIDTSKVVECLKHAQVWEEVEMMPMGINTLIGENGMAISGGQRQRIALARALYKDFELLIMDEATAALDMETEKAVMDSIRQIKGNKTLLMVTHHMSLANECELVYKIENRKIVRVR